MKSSSGHVRSAKDSDIKMVTNFYLDFDFAGSEANEDDNYRLEQLLDEIDFYLGKDGIQKQVRAFTGNGYHMLFALPPMKAEEESDFQKRLRKFRDIIHYEFSEDLRSEGVKLDNTMDLRRVAKIYGTRKPYQGAKLSLFFGKERTDS